ncbi:hypothetical protein H0178_45190 [Cytobacillus firmus]|nr:hypothetical protein [Cytobacillus firmus]
MMTQGRAPLSIRSIIPSYVEAERKGTYPGKNRRTATPRDAVSKLVLLGMNGFQVRQSLAKEKVHMTSPGEGADAL